MGLKKGPSEGGSGGKLGHSGMDHWGYTDEVKETARRRRRIEDKEVVSEHERDSEDSSQGNSDSK
jgi:hypothetical protein